LDEAVTQVNKHAEHLQDAATGLYHHAWSERAGVYSGPFYWGRGNGWVLLAQAELLVALPSSDARQPALLAQFRRQALPLLARQAPNNLWHTVVTRDDFHVETSATALISAALTTAAVHGLVDDTASAAAAMGRNAVWRQVAATGDLAGLVAGVSGPTGPMDQEAAYGTIPIKEFTLYGQGVVLWMGAAMMPVP
jgi:unsaturated rhamnogalacturonyl hydrolase